MSPRNSRTIPLERYHGVPRGWSQTELIDEHQDGLPECGEVLP